MSPPMPQQPLVTQPPAVLVLSEHVHKSVYMQPGFPCSNSEHHTCPEYSLGHINLPVKSPSIQHPCPTYPSRAIRPVGMKVSDSLLGTIETHLVGLVVLVPGPVVLAAGAEWRGWILLGMRWRRVVKVGECSPTRNKRSRCLHFHLLPRQNSPFFSMVLCCVILCLLCLPLVVEVRARERTGETQ